MGTEKMRSDGRGDETLRDVRIIPDFLRSAGGSVLLEMGETRVICAATLEDGVPQFLRGAGRGWLTAEYSLLPAATVPRSSREASRGGVGGRTHEIQRLIGRSLRAVTDLTLLGEKTVRVDCDVIKADGGTRTASITGAFVALGLLFHKAGARGEIAKIPLTDYVAAISVGIVDGELLLDLAYTEDSRAAVDANIVMTGRGNFVEIQATAEGEPFSGEIFARMLAMANVGIRSLLARQREILHEVL